MASMVDRSVARSSKISSSSLVTTRQPLQDWIFFPAVDTLDLSVDLRRRRVANCDLHEYTNLIFDPRLEIQTGRAGQPLPVI
jgi:hypothetical protein